MKLKGIGGATPLCGRDLIADTALSAEPEHLWVVAVKGIENGHDKGLIARQDLIPGLLKLCLSFIGIIGSEAAGHRGDPMQVFPCVIVNEEVIHAVIIHGLLQRLVKIKQGRGIHMRKIQAVDPFRVLALGQLYTAVNACCRSRKGRAP